MPLYCMSPPRLSPAGTAIRLVGQPFAFERSLRKLRNSVGPSSSRRLRLDRSSSVADLSAIRSISLAAMLDALDAAFLSRRERQLDKAADSLRARHLRLLA